MNTPRYQIKEGCVCIEVNLRHIEQLFDSLDPSPFLERDLDGNAAEYIVSSTMEHPVRTPVKIRIHISEEKRPSVLDKTIIDAIHNHFSYSAELMRKKNKRILRQGRINLIVATALLLSCLALAQTIDVGTNTVIGTACKEGLIILGWVAMWRPIDVFLYSWWPQVEMRKVFEKLSKVDISIFRKTSTNSLSVSNEKNH